MKRRTMAKRAAGPDGTWMLGKPYGFDPDTEKAFEAAGAFEDGQRPKLPENAEAPNRRSNKRASR